MEFAKKYISQNHERLYYIKSVSPQDKDAWYFVVISPSKLEAFRKVLEKGDFNLNDYGEIIESGYGQAASVSVVNEINQKYKSDFD